MSGQRYIAEDRKVEDRATGNTFDLRSPALAARYADTWNRNNVAVHARKVRALAEERAK